MTRFRRAGDPCLRGPADSARLPRPVLELPPRPSAHLDPRLLLQPDLRLRTRDRPAHDHDPAPPLPAVPHPDPEPARDAGTRSGDGRPQGEVRERQDAPEPGADEAVPGARLQPGDGLPAAAAADA